MDWPAIARVLIERNALPVALLDRSGKIRLFNSAMEQALGWNRFEVEGRPWSEICVLADQLRDTDRWIHEAFRGALRNYETTAVTKSGGRVIMHFEFSLVGRAKEQGLLVTAKRVLPAPTFMGHGNGRDLDYDVSVIGAEFGQICRLAANGDVVPVPEADRRCFNVLYGLQQPCEDCPLRANQGQGQWPRTAIRHRHVKEIERTELYFEIVTAEPVDASIVRVRVKSISEHTLEAIHEAKLQQIAERANLSQRERDVLRYLLLGRSVEDIATILSITQRTVKYHQANVLEKVGADSRVDLMRLLF